jgi:hypothetical protein
MIDNPVEILVQEVDDYLDAGPVGLYEFVWILNGHNVEASPGELRMYAKRALETALETQRGRLVDADASNHPGRPSVCGSDDATGRPLAGVVPA